ncbi:MAG: hypothetical protein ACO4AI_06185 [Prochlorothrix sp.]
MVSNRAIGTIAPIAPSQMSARRLESRADDRTRWIPQRSPLSIATSYSHLNDSHLNGLQAQPHSSHEPRDGSAFLGAGPVFRS